MLVYVLKFSLCLALFWAFYKALLERESFHSFKRIYLILSLAFSLIVPLITFTTYVDPVITTASGFTASSAMEVVSEDQNAISTPNYLPYLLWGIYLIGVCLFGLHFVKNLLEIRSKIRGNQKVTIKGITNVLLTEPVVPHTFFKYIFYNQEQFENKQIPEEVYWHEETHAIERHSIDVLLIEILIVFCWFSPVLYFVRKAMKLNHEFLADRGVLQKGILPSYYQNTLLAFAESSSRMSLANAINYSLIKKRFIIMKKQTKKSVIFFRLLLIVPLLSFVIYGFSSKETAIKADTSETSVQKQKAPMEQATKDIVSEYNKLAKHYASYPEYDFVVKAKDMVRIRKLYNQMTEAQRAGAEPYPRSTTSITIFITNEGKLIVDEKEVTFESIESTIQKLTKEELSNAFVFAHKKDTEQYIKDRGAMNRSKVPPNDIYISIFSDELVNDPLKNLGKGGKPFKPKTKARVVNHAGENEKLTTYLKDLTNMFERNGVNVY